MLDKTETPRGLARWYQIGPAERRALVELRRSGTISNDVWLRVGRDLDLEDERLDI